MSYVDPVDRKIAEGFKEDLLHNIGKLQYEVGI